MDFIKMTGAGNDFIVLNAESCPALSREEIFRLCDRRYGIGADGLMIIREGAPEPSREGPGGSEEAFSVDFFNADGSSGMLCGNGARCALVFAASRGYTSYNKSSAFRFAGRLYTGLALTPDRARFMLNPRYTSSLEEGLVFEAGGATNKGTGGPQLIMARGRFVDLGSLHLVLDLSDLEFEGTNPAAGESSGHQEVPSLDQLDVTIFGAALRRHPRFAPAGVNVNFCSLIGDKIHIRTFERGVEAETLACGTGSTASALSYALRGLVKPPVRVITRSGEELLIDFDNPDRPARLSLEGPAKVVFEGRI